MFGGYVRPRGDSCPTSRCVQGQAAPRQTAISRTLLTRRIALRLHCNSLPGKFRPVNCAPAHPAQISYPEMHESPGHSKRSGPHRRWGRPFSELSAFSVVGLAVVLLALAAFLAVVWKNSGRMVNNNNRPGHKPGRSRSFLHRTPGGRMPRSPGRPVSS